MREKPIWPVFWALIVVFLVFIGLTLGLSTPTFREFRESLVGERFLSIIRILLSLLAVALGVALLVLTLKGKVGGWLRKFLILTGASVIGMPLGIILHNAVFGLFIWWFGEDFWDRISLGDEPFFFIVAVVICPIAFLVGAIGSIVLAMRQPKL